MTNDTMMYGVRRKPKTKEPHLGKLFLTVMSVMVPGVVVYSYGALWVLKSLGLN